MSERKKMGCRGRDELVHESTSRYGHYLAQSVPRSIPSAIGESEIGWMRNVPRFTSQRPRWPSHLKGKLVEQSNYSILPDGRITWSLIKVPQIYMLQRKKQ